MVLTLVDRVDKPITQPLAKLGVWVGLKEKDEEILDKKISCHIFL